MRKILAAAAIATALATPAHAQYFWGSGPGFGMGGGWNNCANCGMRAIGPGGGFYQQWAGGTNGFGRGMLGWGGVPSANGYGGGWGGGMGMGMLGSLFMGGGGLGMLGGLGSMLGGLTMGGNYYPGAMYQRPGVPPGNYAYGATRYGGGGSYPHPQYRNPQMQGGPGPGYPFAQSQQYGGGAGYRQATAAGYRPPVQYLPAMPRRSTCQIVSNGMAYTKVCY